MLYTKIGMLFAILFLSILASSTQFVRKESFIDKHPMAEHSDYLALRMKFTYPPTSATELKVDVTSILHESGFLENVLSVPIENCKVVTESGKVFLTASIAGRVEREVFCVVTVSLSKILPSDTLFSYSVLLTGSSDYPDPVGFTSTYLDLFTNPYTEKSMLLLPHLESQSSVDYSILPNNDGIFTGLITSKLSMYSNQNKFAKNAKIALSFSIAFSLNNINQCEITYRDYETQQDHTVATLNPPHINLNGGAFSIGELTVSNTYTIICHISTYTPVTNDGYYAIVYYFPNPINNDSPINGKYQYVKQLYLPTAELTVSELKGDTNKYYEARIKIKDLNKPIYLRNMVNYANGMRYTISDPVYAGLASPMTDGVSMLLRLSTLAPQYQTGEILIKIEVDKYDNHLIAPNLASSLVQSSISKSVFDMKPVPNSGTINPTITPAIVETDRGLFLGINVNVAQYVYHMNFPDHITVRGLDANGIYEGDNYSIRQARPYEMSFSFSPPINTNIGVNYILTLKKQQTVVNFPSFPSNPSSSVSDSNYVFIPIVLNLKSTSTANPTYSLYMGFRSPVPNQNNPLYSQTFKLSFQKTVTISGTPVIPEFPIKMDENFQMTNVVFPSCDIHALDISFTMNTNNQLYVNSCAIEDKTYTYGSGLTFNAVSNDVVLFFSTKSTPRTDCSINRTYNLPVVCSLFRTRNMKLINNPNVSVSLSFSSQISNIPTKMLNTVNLSSEMPSFNTVDKNNSYFSMFYSKRPLLRANYESLQTTDINNDVNPTAVSTIETHLGFFRVSFTMTGQHRITGVKLALNSDSQGELVFVDPVEGVYPVQGDCHVIQSNYIDNYSETILNVNKVGMCQFNYQITSETDNKEVTVEYMEPYRVPVPGGIDRSENELHSVWKGFSLPLSLYKPSLSLSIVGKLNLNRDEHTHAVPSSDLLNVDFPQYRILFQYTSNMLISGHKYLLTSNIEHATEDNVSYNFDKCLQFKPFRDPNQPSLVTMVMDQTKNVDGNNINVCEVTLTPKSYFVKSQLVELSIISPNIDIHDNTNSFVNEFFKLNVKKSSANYETRRVNLEMDVNIADVSPEAAPLKYYVLYTDNFNSKPKKCTYPTVKRGNYIFIGPITQKIDASVNINCELDINVKHVASVDSYAYIMYGTDFASLSLNSVTDNAVTELSIEAKHFVVNHNTNTNAVSTVSSVVPVLSWSHQGKDSIDKQIDDAKQLIADSAKTTKDKVFVIELTYSNSTQTAPYSTLSDFYTLSTSGNVQAKFGIQGNQFNQQDLENALNNAIGNNPNLNDLSTSVIIEDIIQQCLAADLGCGALCAPCTGNESCLSDFDCLSGICSFGKCSKLDYQGNGNGNGVVKLSTTAIFLFSIIFTLFFL